jgi:hypothetical protein
MGAPAAGIPGRIRGSRIWPVGVEPSSRRPRLIALGVMSPTLQLNRRTTPVRDGRRRREGKVDRERLST